MRSMKRGRQVGAISIDIVETADGLLPYARFEAMQGLSKFGPSHSSKYLPTQIPLSRRTSQTGEPRLTTTAVFALVFF